MKSRFVCIVTVFLSVLCYGQKAGQKNYLSPNTQTVVDSLRNIPDDSTIDLNPHSRKFQLLKKLNNIASTIELQMLIKYDNNEVVKGYSYIALKLRKDSEADILINAHYKALVILVGDEGGICRKKETFTDDIKRRLLRINACINNSTADTLNNSERRVNQGENKIRKEQGLPQLQNH